MSDSFMERVGTAKRQQPPQPLAPSTAGAQAVQGNNSSLGASRWGRRDNIYFGVGETLASIPAGLYRATHTDYGPTLAKQLVSVDDLIVLPDNAVDVVLREFQQFWTLRAGFQERGFLHKRGYFFWGPPGGGKTAGMQLMAAEIVRTLDGVVLLLDRPDTAAACLQVFRAIEPDRPVVAILEDLDALVERHGEAEYLALLDGEAQVDRIVFVASTNYPERLDRRFVDRPSRFDTIVEVGMPSAAARRAYLSHKEPRLVPDGIDEWVERTEGYSIAHLRELIIAVRVFGQSLDDVIGRLDAMQARTPRGDDSSRKVVGFRT